MVKRDSFQKRIPLFPKVSTCVNFCQVAAHCKSNGRRYWQDEARSNGLRPAVIDGMAQEQLLAITAYGLDCGDMYEFKGLH